MSGYIYHSHGEPLANEQGEIYLAQANGNGGIMTEIKDREALAGAILANSDAAALFYYCTSMLAEYRATHRESIVSAMAGIIIAIHQIIYGNTDFDYDFSTWINDLMELCLDYDYEGSNA